MPHKSGCATGADVRDVTMAYAAPARDPLALRSDTHLRTARGAPRTAAGVPCPDAP